MPSKIWPKLLFINSIVIYQKGKSSKDTPSFHCARCMYVHWTSFVSICGKSVVVISMRTLTPHQVHSTHTVLTGHTCCIHGILFNQLHRSPHHPYVFVCVYSHSSRSVHSKLLTCRVEWVTSYTDWLPHELSPNTSIHCLFQHVGFGLDVFFYHFFFFFFFFFNFYYAL